MKNNLLGYLWFSILSAFIVLFYINYETNQNIKEIKDNLQIIINDVNGNIPDYNNK